MIVGKVEGSIEEIPTLWITHLASGSPFYNGLNPSTRQMIDTVAGGTINSKMIAAILELIKQMAMNSY